MQAIKNGYAEYYYLTTDGRVYNSKTDNYLIANAKHSYKLLQENGKYKRVSVRTLYKLVYNKLFCIDNIESLDNEIWKEIEGSEGYYYISNYGRIKSLYKYEAIILKPSLTATGYERLQIKQDGIVSNKLVHRLVAAAFLPAPERIDWQLHHKDFNKRNNKADNLIWVSIADHVKLHNERNIDTEADPDQIQGEFTQTIKINI